MDETTEYCSFVSVDYIICECGDDFPNEDALKVHLELGHYISNSKKIPDKPSVTTEILPEANLQPNICLIDLEGNEVNEYYLQRISETKTLKPHIKEEDLAVQFINQDHNYGAEGKMIVEDLFVGDPLASKHIRFKKQKEDDDTASVKSEVQEFYYCDVCGKSFKNEKLVQIHMHRMHLSAEEQMLSNTNRKNDNLSATNRRVCKACGLKYALWTRVCQGCGVKRQLHKKLNKSPTNRPATCDICGVTRSSKAALRGHIRMHTGERPYHCAWCPKTFARPLSLQVHTRSHTGERPYACQDCPKAFPSITGLVRHKRIHTGEKPYACPDPECDKAFAQSKGAKLHYQTIHLKERPFECPECGKAFALAGNMRVHYQTVHLKLPCRKKKQKDVTNIVPKNERVSLVNETEQLSPRKIFRKRKI